MRNILLTFLALALGYSAFIAAVPPSRPGVTVSQEALNRQTVERYRYRIKAPVVIVGSSLAARFATAGDNPCIYDLSIAGGSALTGLEIIAQEPIKPRKVLVEINLLDRPLDTRFAERPLWVRQYLPLTWVENSPVNRLLSFIAVLRGSSGGGRAAQTGAALEAPLRLQQATYDKPVPAATLAGSVRNLRHRLVMLRRAGVEPVLFEMPVHPSLEGRVRARQMHAAIARAFPDVRFVASATLANGMAVRTTDGVHLDETEAKQVFERLLAATGVDCSG